MCTQNLQIKTLSPIGNFSTISFQPIAYINKSLYFINTQKLDMVLSLMGLLGTFVEYSNHATSKDITKWLKEHALLTTELLNEISFYKTELKHRKDITSFNRFFKEGDMNLSNDNLQNAFSVMFKNNLKNVILFDFIKTSISELEEYINTALIKFKTKPRFFLEYNNLLDYLAHCALAMDRMKLKEKFTEVEKMKIHFELPQNFKEQFIFETINTDDEKFYQECIKSEIEMNFSIKYFKDNKICTNLEKYLQIAEFINSNRLKEEQKSFIHTKKKTQNPSTVLCKEKEPSPPKRICSSNFSFLNDKQLLFLLMDEQHRSRLNKILILHNLKSIEDKFFYFSNRRESKQKFLNYAQIKI